MATDAAHSPWRVHAALCEPVDASGLGVFRAGFGVIMSVAIARFWWMGWIETILLEPSYHFKYDGFSWVEPLPAGWIHAQFLLMFLSALGLALGWKTRWMAAIFFVLFTWAELIEKAAYLNHYYLVSLIALLLVLVPSSEAFSVKRGRTGLVPAWAPLWLRLQMCVVYFFAGAAKIGTDWLVHGEPLYTWLQVHADLPWIGPFLMSRELAITMSWGGMAFDLSIAFLLWHARTRRPAYLVAVVFHVCVGLMFPIGMFSWIMIWCGTLFFAYDWPRKMLGTPREHVTLTGRTMPPPWHRLAVLAMVIWLVVQALMPVRHLMYPGEVNWTERGFRFAWRVMLIEKTGQIDYRVVVDDPDTGRARTFRVHPRKELTALQYRMLCTQPDMMIAYAHELGARHAAALDISADRVRVYADVFVAMNGHPSQRYLDPSRDLTRTREGEGLILPLQPRDE